MRYLQKIQYKLVREEVSEYHTRHMRGSRDVYGWFRHLENLDREKFIVVCLNVKHRVVCFDEVSMGTTSQCTVHPREVVKGAILSNASAIVLIHNHPSGNCGHSAEDNKLTIMLKEACSLFDISVLDHVIIGHNEYYSFTDQVKTTVFSSKND